SLRKLPPLIRALPQSESRPFRARARTPASRGYPHPPASDRNAASLRNARRPQWDPHRNGRPTASYFGRLLERRTNLNRQPDQVDESAGVALIVLGAHGEAGDIQ